MQKNEIESIDIEGFTHFDPKKGNSECAKVRLSHNEKVSSPSSLHEYGCFFV